MVYVNATRFQHGRFPGNNEPKGRARKVELDETDRKCDLMTGIRAIELIMQSVDMDGRKYLIVAMVIPINKSLRAY